MAKRPVRTREAAPAEASPLELVLTRNPIPFGFHLGYLANLFSGPIYKTMETRHGIGRPEWIILFCLATRDKLTANEISRMSARPKANVSRAVHKLIRLGLIRRAMNPDDQRSALLGLTTKGDGVYRATLPAFVEREAGMLSTLSSRQVAQLHDLLQRLTIREDGWDVPY